VRLAPAITRPLARRIDRLARRAHAFHRLAHHPLCDRYAGEIIMLGRRRRICRGCALVGCGALSGLTLGVLAPSWLGPGAAVASAAVTLGPALVSLARPELLRAPSSKLLTRAFPATGIFAVLGTALRVADLHAVFASFAACVLSALVVVAYRRRSPDRSACAGYPERAVAQP